jgi:hypothetical protein
MTRTKTVASLLAMLALAACNKGSSGAPSTDTATSGGATVVAAPTTASGTRHWICKNPPATGSKSIACGTCVERECSAPFHAMLTACPGYIACVEACECSDRSCLFACVPKIDATCQTGSADQGKCEKAHCADACAVQH